MKCTANQESLGTSEWNYRDGCGREGAIVGFVWRKDEPIGLCPALAGSGVQCISAGQRAEASSW